MERAYIVILIIASIEFKYINFSMIIWIASYPKVETLGLDHFYLHIIFLKMVNLNLNY